MQNHEAVQNLMNSFDEFKNRHDENLNKRDEIFNNKIKEVQDQTDRIEELLNRPFALNSIKKEIHGNKKASRYVITTDGKRLPILDKDDRLAAYADSTNEERGWSIGDFARASMGVPIRSNAIQERGTATTPEFLANKIVDDIRAKNTLIAAGASTMKIEGPTTIAKISGDPTAYAHVEGIADITPSLPTFAPVELDPAMIVVQVPLSIEVVQDSANLDALLRMSISAAISAKLDATGVTALLADVAISESTVSHDPATWVGVAAATGAHLALDGSVPKSLIANSSEFNSRNSQLDGSGRWVERPGYLSAMLDLHSSRMTAGKAMMGDFNTGLLLVVRQGLRLELIRWNGMADASHMLVAYMRAGFYTVQPKALFRALKTVA